MEMGTKFNINDVGWSLAAADKKRFYEQSQAEIKKRVDAEKKRALDEIKKQAEAQRSELLGEKSKYEEMLLDQRKDLSHSYKTSMAGVTLNDSLFGMPNITPTLRQSKTQDFPIGAVLVIGFIGYIFFRKNRR